MVKLITSSNACFLVGHAQAVDYKRYLKIHDQTMTIFFVVGHA
jgi:hypothetical protein